VTLRPAQVNRYSMPRKAGIAHLVSPAEIYGCAAWHQAAIEG